MSSTYGSDYYKLLRIPSHDVNGTQIPFNPTTADWSGNVLNSGTFCDGKANIASYNYTAGITAYALNKFSRFGGAGNNGGAELPIELTSLQAMPVDNKFININWVTATEVNNAGFDVQRSTDGVEFESIGFVQGAGNSTNELQYKLDDKDVVANTTYYYRLNQIDFDGKSELTYVVSARLTSENVFVIGDFIPNPTANATRIEVTSSDVKKMNIAIFNTLGQLIQINDQTINAGSNIINFDLSDVADGTYYAVMTVGEETFNKKLVVTK